MIGNDGSRRPPGDIDNAHVFDAETDPPDEAHEESDYAQVQAHQGVHRTHVVRLRD